MKKFNSLDEAEFYDKYMVLLEKFSNDIRDVFGYYYSDHSLVGLCEELENELLNGGDKYE